MTGRVTNGLYALWRADRADGGIRPGHDAPAFATWHDYSGNARHGTINGLVPRTAEGPHTNSDSDRDKWRDLSQVYNPEAALNGFSFTTGSGWEWDGVTGIPALVFDGAGDYLSYAANPGVTSTFSVEFWLYIRSYGTWNTLLLENGTYTSSGFRLGYTSTGKPTLWMTQNGGTYTGTADTATVPLGRWVHLVVTWTGGVGKCYIDGQEVAFTGNAGTLVGPTGSARIGGDIGGGSFAGSISIFRYYGVVLTPAEVQTNYRVGPSAASGFCSGPYQYLSAAYAIGAAGWGGRGTRDEPYYLRFGGDDYVSLPAMNIASDGSGTLEAWFRTTSTRTAYLVSLADAANDHQFGLVISASGTRPTALYNNSASNTLLAPSTGAWPVCDGRWHHIAGVVGGGYLQCYFDGAAIGAAVTVPSGTQNLDRGGLGRRNSIVPGAYYVGDLALAAVYEGALSAAEVGQNYHAGPSLERVAVYFPTTIKECVVAPTQTVAVTCEALSSGTAVAGLSLVGGSVTADSRRSVFRDATLELAPDDARGHDDLYDLLTSPGLELAVARGFRLADGSTITASLGRFVVEDLGLKEDASGTSLSVSAADLSVRIARARWTDPYQIAAGTSLAEALVELLSGRWGGVRTAIDPAAYPETLGAQVVFDAGADSDPWADACKLAEAFGYTLVFDVEGRAVLIATPDPETSPAVFTFARGETAIITERTRSAAISRTYNGVIATGEGADIETPVRGEAWDMNPSSPTYRYGPLGQVPYFYSSSLLTTADQCEQAATKILAGLTGRVEQLAWSSVVHPGLSPLDVVGVEQADGSVKNYVLDSVTIPLDAGGTMSAITREISVAY